MEEGILKIKTPNSVNIEILHSKIIFVGVLYIDLELFVHFVCHDEINLTFQFRIYSLERIQLLDLSLGLSYYN